MTANKGSKSPLDKPEAEPNGPSSRFEEAFPGEPQESHEALPSPEDIRELHDQIEILNKALKEAQEKVDDHWQRLLRKEAEFQNIQRRMQQDVDNARKFGIERFAVEVLQILDSVEQGLTFAQNGQTTIQNLAEGMTLTHSMLMNVLDKEGIKVIDPQGQVFDPTYHEALSMQETADLEPNKVVAVIQKGYMLHNRLLRPARVIVSKAVQQVDISSGEKNT